MKGPESSPSSERPAGWVLAIRYGIPAAFILAGQVILIITGDAVSWAGFTGAGVAILLIGFLVRIGTAGDRERDREDAARAYFEQHGRWPDEEREPTRRTWRLPENVVTPESEAAERARRER
jgi:hypothetical protein